MNYGNAVVLAAEELAPSAWNAPRLSDTPGGTPNGRSFTSARRRGAVARGAARGRAREGRHDDAMRERGGRGGARERFNARSWRRKRDYGGREKKRAEEEAVVRAREASAPRSPRAPRLRASRRRRRRSARRATRLERRRGGKPRRLREPRQAAAEALILKAVDVSAAEAKAERDRLAQRALRRRRSAGRRRRRGTRLCQEARTAKPGGEVGGAAAAEGRSEEVAADPDSHPRHRRARHAGGERHADRGLFDRGRR